MQKLAEPIRGNQAAVSRGFAREAKSDITASQLASVRGIVSGIEELETSLRSAVARGTTNSYSSLEAPSQWSDATIVLRHSKLSFPKNAADAMFRVSTNPWTSLVEIVAKPHGRPPGRRDRRYRQPVPDRCLLVTDQDIILTISCHELHPRLYGIVLAAQGQAWYPQRMLDLTHPVALIMIDVQRAFDEWEAAGQRRNNPDASARIADLLQAFRSHGKTVFHIRHESINPSSNFWPMGSGFAVKDEAREISGEVVITKRVNSSFIGTNLEDALRSAGIRQIVICGATTNHCVETTTRMAGNLGFDTYLVRDAAWTFDRVGPDGELHAAEDIHAMTLANLHGEFASIVSTSDVIRALGQGA